MSEAASHQGACMSEEQSRKACPRAIAKRQVKSIHSSTKPKELLLALCVAIGLVQLPLISARADRTGSPTMWAVAANIRDGEYSGSGIYLTPGLVITAAHVTAGWTGHAEVYIDGAGFPASRVKQGAFRTCRSGPFFCRSAETPSKHSGNPGVAVSSACLAWRSGHRC
jgi:hypothetical protein